MSKNRTPPPPWPASSKRSAAMTHRQAPAEANGEPAVTEMPATPPSLPPASAAAVEAKAQSIGESAA